MNTSELVQPRHLIRSAEIYVRQSSPNQVLTNKESQRMQYALRDRACSLGWQEHDTHGCDRAPTCTQKNHGTFSHFCTRSILGRHSLVFPNFQRLRHAPRGRHAVRPFV